MQKKQTTSSKSRPAPHVGSWERGDDRSSLEERLLTADEVARLLHVSSSFVYRLTARGDLPCIRMGPRAVRFLSKDVRGYVRKLSANRKAGG